MEIVGKSGRWRKERKERNARTSSSIREISDCRYSSMVRWNASLSLRFTGTRNDKIVLVCRY